MHYFVIGLLCLQVLFYISQMIILPQRYTYFVVMSCIVASFPGLLTTQ